MFAVLTSHTLYENNIAFHLNWKIHNSSYNYLVAVGVSTDLEGSDVVVLESTRQVWQHVSWLPRWEELHIHSQSMESSWFRMQNAPPVTLGQNEIADHFWKRKCRGEKNCGPNDSLALFPLVFHPPRHIFPFLGSWGSEFSTPPDKRCSICHTTWSSKMLILCRCWYLELRPHLHLALSLLPWMRLQSFAHLPGSQRLQGNAWVDLLQIRL